MNEIKQLPNKEINSSGSISKKFIESGIDDFHHACQWVKDLPYGYNSNHDDPLIIFDEKKGICTTKHGAIAMLAQEIGLDVHKMLGFYKLNEQIVSGTSKIIDKYGLDYIPQIHCFLSFQMNFVDLTEDNCHGRNKQPDEYDIIFRVSPDLSETEELEYYKLGLDYYFMSDEKLSNLTKNDLISILKECNESHKHLCSLR
jgi:hypothetical protein